MSFAKWLISPVLSLLVVSPSIAQTQWIELGRHQGSIVRLNPDVQINGSAVMYEILIQLDQPAENLYSVRTQILALCDSKKQAVSSSEGLNQQGRVIRTNRVSESEMNWLTPENDVYGKAFKLACDSRN